MESNIPILGVNIGGATPQKPDPRDFQYQIPAAAPLPDSVDLRDTGFVPTPLVQDGNSCQSNATAALIDFLLARDGHLFIPSRPFIYYNARKLTYANPTDPLPDQGADIRNAIKGVAQFGVCHTDQWWDVDSNNGTGNPWAQANPNFAPPQSVYDLAKWCEALRYEAVSVDALPYVLAAGLPVVIAFPIYSTFYAAGGVVEAPAIGEDPHGGHAVLCIGYKQMNGRRYWLIQNSWGVTSGDGTGHNWISEDYLTKPVTYSDGSVGPCRGYDFWTITQLTGGPTPLPLPAPPSPIVKRRRKLALMSTTGAEVITANGTSLYLSTLDGAEYLDFPTYSALTHAGFFPPFLAGKPYNRVVSQADLDALIARNKRP